MVCPFAFLSTEQLNFSISRLVKDPDSDDEDNNNSYEQRNHQRTHHESNGKVTPHSEVESSCKDSCTKSRSRSSSRSRSPTRSCSVSPELEVDSPPPPLRMNESPTNTNIFQVNFWYYFDVGKLPILTWVWLRFQFFELSLTSLQFFYIFFHKIVRFRLSNRVLLKNRKHFQCQHC